MPVEIEWALDESGFKTSAGAPVARRGRACARRNLAQASRPQRPSGRRRLGLGARRRRQLRVRAWPRCARRHSGHARRRPGAQSYSAAGRRRRRRAWRLDIASRRAWRASAASRWCLAYSTPRGGFRTARRSPSTASPASCGGWHDEPRRSRAFSSPSRSPKAQLSGCARWRRSRSIRTPAASSAAARSSPPCGAAISCFAFCTIRSMPASFPPIPACASSRRSRSRLRISTSKRRPRAVFP